MALRVCGPKLSMCCMLLAIWGIVMLAMLGIFFRIRSPALIEDLPVDTDVWQARGWTYDYIYELYAQASTNCFIAAGMYVAVFAISFVMWRINKRSDYTTQ